MSGLDDLIVAMRREGLFDGTPDLGDRAPLTEALWNLPQDQVEDANLILRNLFERKGYRKILRSRRNYPRPGLGMFFLPLEDPATISVSMDMITSMMRKYIEGKEQTHILSRGFYTPSGYHLYFEDLFLADFLCDPLFLKDNFCPHSDLISLCEWYVGTPLSLHLLLKPVFEARGGVLTGKGGFG